MNNNLEVIKKELPKEAKDLIDHIGRLVSNIQDNERVTERLTDKNSIESKRFAKLPMSNIKERRAEMRDKNYEVLEEKISEFEKLNISKDQLKKAIEQAYNDLAQLPEDAFSLDQDRKERFIRGLEYLIS